MKISNTPDPECKVMIIKILTGLEKIVEDISESLNKEIKKNRSEMTNTVNEIKNIQDGINRRLQEAKEQISDLGGRLMESNQGEQERLYYTKIRTDRIFSYTTKHNNTCFIKILEEGERGQKM